MKLSQTGENLVVAAAKAGMDEKTARKWLRGGKQPSESRKGRTYRTRADDFAEVWGEVEEMLEREASLEAKTIFEYLCRKYPERYQEAQLRTLQRRVKVWRAVKGGPREVYFAQQHVPGRQAQSDFTHLSELGVRIGGQAYKHLFYHFTLVYSNWEWGMICASESWESLSAGIQQALWVLGGVPAEHRTDSLSAAVKPIGSREEFTERYQGLLRHYGMRASRTTPGRSHENGDIEQSHHRFKQAVDQELMLRGSRDFDSREDYEAFLSGMLVRRNGGRSERLAEELKVLRHLPERRLEAYSKEALRVSRNSTISVRRNHYSVPSQLIGERVEVRIYSGHLEIWYSGEMIERLERLHGEGKAVINYRHIIHSLVRKPGAFAHYRYHASLFPRLVFRLAYDELQQRMPGQAEREYLQLLKLAAEESEERVGEALRRLIDGGEAINSSRVRELVTAAGGDSLSQLPQVSITATRLKSYDGLLDSREVAV
ncbi:IS21 family transposase [Shinella sp.]|uniref:IS21 family transposase n=1 Tax=Shinella sp. TaxID=1870904 RepID=UPI00258CFCC2|nr:IS21 family transposase [Shinella sp.]MCW5712865.1 IS21 family transposase [Shinella sp.]